MGVDYHNKPLLGVRVDAELRDWGKAEAERRSQSFGDFVAGLFTAERDRMANRVANPAPAVFVAAEEPRPQRAGKSCKHKNMRMSKGVCPDCQEWVSPASSRTNGGQ